MTMAQFQKNLPFVSDTFPATTSMVIVVKAEVALSVEATGEKHPIQFIEEAGLARLLASLL